MSKDQRVQYFVVGACWGLLLGFPLSTQAQMMPPISSASPRQTVSNGEMGDYPSTEKTPSSASANTPYPSTANTPRSSAAHPSPSGGNFAGLPYNDALSGLNPPASGGIDGKKPLYVPYGSPEAMTAAAAKSMGAEPSIENLLVGEEPWTWQLLPEGLLYRSYLAGNREPRLGTQWIHERQLGWQWDATLGGRVGVVRYGTTNESWPEGWQLDFEGAAFVRMNLEHDRDVDDADFRAGIPLTTRQGPWEFKFGYYHLSSHLGDEYMVRNRTLSRINYVRESLILGAALYLNRDIRLYSEAGWTFHEDGGAEPWEFQFGVDWSSTEPSGPLGAPFFAINCHLRQETDFSGNLTVQTGWQWRGRNGHLLRTGMQYFNGLSDQSQFYSKFEDQIGIGLWYDF
jgi:hypothetical protein